MGLPEKQIWLEPGTSNRLEPVIHTTANAFIEVTSLQVVPQGMKKVEDFMLLVVREYWNELHLNDIKVMRANTGSEFLIISSWQLNGVLEKGALPRLRDALKPLIAEGLVLKIESKSNDYRIVE